MFLAGCIVVLLARRDDDKGAGLQLIFLLHYLCAAIPFHAINKDVLVAAMYALAVVILGLWIVSDVRNIQAFDGWAAGAKIVYDLTWKDNRTLTCEAFFFPEYAVELHNGFP